MNGVRLKAELGPSVICGAEKSQKVDGMLSLGVSSKWESLFILSGHF